jgi:hypothetical protein
MGPLFATLGSVTVERYCVGETIVLLYNVNVVARVAFLVIVLEDALELPIFSVILLFNAGGETNTSVAVDSLSSDSAKPSTPSDSF